MLVISGLNFVSVSPICTTHYVTTTQSSWREIKEAAFFLSEAMFLLPFDHCFFSFSQFVHEKIWVQMPETGRNELRWKSWHIVKKKIHFSASIHVMLPLA